MRPECGFLRASRTFRVATNMIVSIQSVVSIDANPPTTFRPWGDAVPLSPRETTIRREASAPFNRSDHILIETQSYEAHVDPIAGADENVIRQALRTAIAAATAAEEAIVVEELNVCSGVARVDLAVLNGAIHGYEIKSDRDSLARLKSQMMYYNESLEYVTIVCGERLHKAARDFVPDWWGILSVRTLVDGIVLTPIRPAKPNPELLVTSYLEFLWRGEALHLLTTFGLDKGMKSANKQRLRERLASVEWPELKARVLRTMKARESWVLVEPQKSRAGLYRRNAKS